MDAMTGDTYSLSIYSSLGKVVVEGLGCVEKINSDIIRKILFEIDIFTISITFIGVMYQKSQFMD